MSHVWQFDHNYKRQKYESNFMDKMPGNIFSHDNRIFEFNSNQLPIDVDFEAKDKVGPTTSKALKFLKDLQEFFQFEASVDYFGGV